METELLGIAKYRVIRDEHGYYFTEYAEGERATREYQRGLDAAVVEFVQAVKEEEMADLRDGCY